jgi:hypothetical protein
MNHKSVKSYSLPVMSIIKLFSLSSRIIIALLIFSQVACVDLEFDTPSTGGFDPNLSVNSTIAELKAMHTFGQYEEITDDVIISGIVNSNDEAGNFFKQLIIQDSSGGIEIRLEMTDIHNIYPPGRKVYVKAKGLWLNDYNGLIQLSAGKNPIEDQSIRIPESIVRKFIVPATLGHTVTPKTLTIDQLKITDVSTLVKLENVQFVSADAGQKWANSVFEQSVNRELEDCSRRRVIVRSSGFAEFADDFTPTGGGTFVGVLGVFGSDFQFTIRDLNDVMMTGDRCVVAINESFSGIDSDDDIILPDWSNIAVKGTRLWIAKIFNGNHYAQASAFGDQAPEMESWLITPPIVLNVPKKITFESAKAFYVHSGLSVWISSDFNGSDVAAATWQQLFPTLAEQNSPDHTFIPSGDIDLSTFSGTVHIGFKYVGSGPGGLTSTFRIDNVKVENL